MKRYEFMDGSLVQTRVDCMGLTEFLAPRGQWQYIGPALAWGLIREVDVAPDLNSVKTWEVIAEKVGIQSVPETLRFHASQRSSFAKKIMQRLEELGMLEAFLDE